MYFSICMHLYSFPGGASGANARRCERHGFNPWTGKIPWRRAWQSTPVFLPGESYGQRSLAGYDPWGHKQTWLKWLSIHTHSLHICLYSIYTKIIYVHISKHIHMYTHVIYHNIYVIGPNFHNLVSEVLLPPFYPWENVIKKRVWGFFKLLNVTQLDHSEFREFTFWYKQYITAKFKENGFLWLFYGNLIMNLNFYGEREVMVEGEILAQNWTWWLWDQRVSGCPWNSGNPSWRTRHCGQKLTREIHWLAKI